MYISGGVEYRNREETMEGQKDAEKRNWGGRTSVVLKLGLGWGCTEEWDENPGRRINNGRRGALFEKPILKLNTVYTNDNTLNRTCYKRKYK